ncbi:hypothetical protein EDD18DRAFT_1110067 [Armillaria luteobubalina]|uniref:Apple domain-containing protein n=1 Tax=Armillaria luteobubalina TaxID=153913 RepID=A0AA39PU49_9AGAR|nr:hypothetical protein EDD18DRAFT_1110067 [Armillaria luteobubalina]
MHFSVAAILPLMVLAVPALSASIQARDGSVDHKGKDGGSKDNNYRNKGKDDGHGDCTWMPLFEHKNDFKGWNKGKYTPYEHKEVTKINFEIGKCIPLFFIHVTDIDVFSECKSLCEKDDRCNSCQAYSCDEKDDKFVCELFVEIIDIDTWKEDCDEGKDNKDHKDGKKDDRKDDRKDDKKKDDKKDNRKYYDTSAWNAHYGY